MPVVQFFQFDAFLLDETLKVLVLPQVFDRLLGPRGQIVGLDSGPGECSDALVFVGELRFDQGAAEFEGLLFQRRGKVGPGLPNGKRRQTARTRRSEDVNLISGCRRSR